METRPMYKKSKHAFLPTLRLRKNAYQNEHASEKRLPSLGSALLIMMNSSQSQIAALLLPTSVWPTPSP